MVSASVCVGLWISILIIKNYFPETLEHVRWISLIVFGISLGLGIPLLIREPSVARLTMGNANESYYASVFFPQGVANYSWYTPAAIAWPVIANWLYRSQQSFIRKILGWGALVAVSIAILLSTFTMAIVLLIIGIISWFFLVFIMRNSLIAFYRLFDIDIYFDRFFFYFSLSSRLCTNCIRCEKGNQYGYYLYGYS